MKERKEVLKKVLPKSIHRVLRDGYAIYYALAYNYVLHKEKHKKIDYFIVSFPKSGRTWLRTILGKYFQLIYDQPLTLELDKVEKSPKIKFSHNIKDIKFHKNKKVVYLLRDPRDILVSYYHHCKNRDKVFDSVFVIYLYRNFVDLIKSFYHYKINKKRIFNGNISKFIRSKEWGIDKIIAYFNSLKKYEKYPSKVLYLSYENIHSNPENELAKLLDFMEIETNDQKLREAIEFSSFKNMQKMEKEAGFDNPRLKPADQKNVNSFKVRKGKIGTYKDELVQEDFDYLNKEMEKCQIKYSG